MCFYATQYIKRKLVIDDSLDVFPVHGVGGILGTLFAGIFCSTELGMFSGYGFGGDNTSIGEQLGVQFTGVVATFTYTAVVSYLLLKLVGAMTSGLRVTQDEEQQGLDLVLHEEEGYKL